MHAICYARIGEKKPNKSNVIEPFRIVTEVVLDIKLSPVLTSLNELCELTGYKINIFLICFDFIN